MTSKERSAIWYLNNKELTIQRAKEWSERNPDANKLFKKNRRDKDRGTQNSWARRNPILFMWSSARRRSKRLNVPFDIKPEDIVIPTHCPILNIELYKDLKRTAHSPSLDRIIPSLGYVKGNIQVISFRANTMKNNGTLDELIALGDWAWQQKVIEVI